HDQVSISRAVVVAEHGAARVSADILPHLPVAANALNRRDRRPRTLAACWTSATWVACRFVAHDNAALACNAAVVEDWRSGAPLIFLDGSSATRPGQLQNRTGSTQWCDAMNLSMVFVV